MDTRSFKDMVGEFNLQWAALPPNDKRQFEERVAKLPGLRGRTPK